MTDSSKIKPTHTHRVALVYIRQSTPTQVEQNRESTARQYALADRACQLGSPREQVIVIDEDLGLSGSSVDKRSGFTRLTNEAARGELRRGLPVGFVWGEQDGEVLFHPDEAVTNAIRTVFERFAEFGSARRVWLWFRSEGLPFPLQDHPGSHHSPIRWVAPTYTALHHILTNPVYAGAYTYGKTRSERYVDEHGAVKKRMRNLPMAEWAVLIPDHHPGFIDGATFQANQARLDSNTRPRPHHSGGAVREGSALLQGMATSGHCGRRLHTHYPGRNSPPA